MLRAAVIPTPPITHLSSDMTNDWTTGTFEDSVLPRLLPECSPAVLFLGVCPGTNGLSQRVTHRGATGAFDLSSLRQHLIFNISITSGG